MYLPILVHFISMYGFELLSKVLSLHAKGLSLVFSGRTGMWETNLINFGVLENVLISLNFLFGFILILCILIN